MIPKSYTRVLRSFLAALMLAAPLPFARTPPRRDDTTREALN